MVRNTKIRCGGGGTIHIGTSRVAVGGVVEADKQVACAVIHKRGVELDVHPARTCGRECARPDKVTGRNRLHVTGASEFGLADVLHVHLDATHGEARRVGVLKGYRRDGASHSYLRGSVNLLRQGIVVVHVDRQCVMCDCRRSIANRHNLLCIRCPRHYQRREEHQQ